MTAFCNNEDLDNLIRSLSAVEAEDNNIFFRNELCYEEIEYVAYGLQDFFLHLKICISNFFKNFKGFNNSTSFKTAFLETRS